MEVNDIIATLIKRQSYDERAAMAQFIADAAREWASDPEQTLSQFYFETLLDSWAEEVLVEAA